ncbi:MAG: phage baseplate assembly protein V [Acidobacteriaceae bacterium]|nr:phage baseplate assembly protein V [Acidobacteriaceae bacterium]
MDKFFNSIKQASQGLDRQMGQPRFGIVASVNPNDYTARVFVQPDNVLSGWLPIASQWIGNGWGLVCPPSQGDQVIVVPHDGDADNMVIIGRVYAAQGGVTPPPAPSGEFWLVHQSGSYIKLLNSGGIVSNGPWSHTGSFSATGNITAGNGTGDQVDLLNHTHTSETPGTPTSAPIAGT